MIFNRIDIMKSVKYKKGSDIDIAIIGDKVDSRIINILDDYLN